MAEELGDKSESEEAIWKGESIAFKGESAWQGCVMISGQAEEEEGRRGVHMK